MYLGANRRRVAIPNIRANFDFFRGSAHEEIDSKQILFSRGSRDSLVPAFVLPAPLFANENCAQRNFFARGEGSGEWALEATANAPAGAAPSTKEPTIWDQIRVDQILLLKRSRLPRERSWGSGLSKPPRM